MKNKLTVTIGIPAFNEEANVGKLLQNLLLQRENGFIIEKIIVVSDGSTDQTVKMVQKVKDKRICLVEEKIRKGSSNRQEQIIRQCTSDVLLFLDADVLPKTKDFVKKIIQPILDNKFVGLVSAKILPAKPKNYFESMVVFSHKLKLSMDKDLQGNNEVYLCHGPARALSKRLYQTLHFPNTIGDDAYCYFECKKRGFKFVYKADAVVLYRAPGDLMGQIRQSTRFYECKLALQKYFDKEILEREYHISKWILVKTAIRGLFNDPIRASIYTLMLFVSKLLRSVRAMNSTHLWIPVKSSKHVS